MEYGPSIFGDSHSNASGCQQGRVGNSPATGAPKYQKDGLSPKRKGSMVHYVGYRGHLLFVEAKTLLQAQAEGDPP